MAFDFKRNTRNSTCRNVRLEIVDVPEMNYIAVRGSGDPTRKRRLQTGAQHSLCRGLYHQNEL